MSDTNDPTGTYREEDDGVDSTKPLWEAKDAPGSALIGQTVGHYRITAVIGRGGMGVVYEAEQEQPKRIVALKVINPGVTSEPMLRRFEHESNVLGRLQHPNIGYIFEAGTFDAGAGAQPFFAMELVRGRTLTHHADAMHLGTRERLELMIKICKAVQYAHQRGIIHRDLKPGNILVTEDGEPKILDFGVARTTDSDIQTTTLRTDIGQLIGTIPYMSPEQAGGDPDELDTRSDVYALGVVAYELLAGRLPYDLQQKMIHEAVRIIRDESPTRLSSLNTSLRGDVEIIIGKALEKEKERRYQSANDFASDIEHYLSDEPIEARPPSAAYQFRKFARRNKAFVGGVAAVFVVLVAGLIGMALLYAQTEEARADAVAARDAEAEQRRIAEQREAEAIEARREAEAAKEAEAQRAEELEQVAEFQASQLADIETELMGIRLRRDLLDTRRAFLEARDMDEEAIEANLRELEQSLTGINFTEIALRTLDENIFDRALMAIDEQFAAQPLIRARLLQTLANTLRELGLLDRATQPQTEALDIRRRTVGDEHPSTLTSINSMGALLFAQGKLAEAEPYFGGALEARRRVLGDEHPDTLTSIGNMGALLASMGRYDDAMRYYREALEGRRRVLGEEHRYTLTSINSVGLLLVEQGQYTEAEPYFREALSIRRRVLGDEHSDTLKSINDIGFLLQMQGKLDEAMPYLREALEGRRRVLGDEHPNTLGSINNMGGVLWQQGKFSEAELYFREALEALRRTLGDEHPHTLTSIGNMGGPLLSMGRYGEAEPYYREVLEVRRRVLGDEHPDTLGSINNMGFLLLEQGKYGEAEPYYREVLETSRRVLGDDHPSTLVAINSMGVLFQRQGKYAEAEPYCREAMETGRRVLGDKHPSTLRWIGNMGSVLRDLGQLDDAERLGAEAVETARRVLSDGHWHTAVYLTMYSRTLTRMERFAEAEQRMLEAHAIFEAALGPAHERTIGAIRQLAELYEAWHEAEPDDGYDAKAAEWRAKLPASDGADDVADDDSESGD